VKNFWVGLGFFAFFGIVVALYPSFPESDLAALAAAAVILIAGLLAIIWSGRGSSSNDSRRI
tara:strand:- start:317 stop:502 length:186 start_codon:yes stop_codon:yes gene_type:complete